MHRLGKRLRRLPDEINARVLAIPHARRRGDLDVAIARFAVDRATIADVITELARIENSTRDSGKP